MCHCGHISLALLEPTYPTLVIPVILAKAGTHLVILAKAGIHFIYDSTPSSADQAFAAACG
jgi:hypothetical protein